jgi:hypothetical protein
MKNHDFILSQKERAFGETNEISPDMPGYQYIIAYREDPIKQLEAWYRFFNRNKYDIDECCKFIKDNKAYYEAFVEKWLNNNHFKFTYEQYVEEPLKIILQVFELFYPGIEPDMEFIRTLMETKRYKVRLLHSIDEDIYAIMKSAYSNTYV